MLNSSVTPCFGLCTGGIGDSDWRRHVLLKEFIGFVEKQMSNRQEVIEYLKGICNITGFHLILKTRNSGNISAGSGSWERHSMASFSVVINLTVKFRESQPNSKLGSRTKEKCSWHHSLIMGHSCDDTDLRDVPYTSCCVGSSCRSEGVGWTWGIFFVFFLFTSACFLSGRRGIYTFWKT